MSTKDHYVPEARAADVRGSLEAAVEDTGRKTSSVDGGRAACGGGLGSDTSEGGSAENHGGERVELHVDSRDRMEGKRLERDEIVGQGAEE